MSLVYDDGGNLAFDPLASNAGPDGRVGELFARAAYCAYKIPAQWIVSTMRV